MSDLFDLPFEEEPQAETEAREAALNKFLTALPQKFETATGNPRLNAILVEADEASGRATDIERISLSAGELQELADIADDRPVRSSV